MAIAEQLSGLHPMSIPLALVALLSVSFWYLFLSHREAIGKNAPTKASGHLPVLGALSFFTQRWDWYKQAIANSKSGQFSFQVGPYPVIGLAGEASRKIFFESKGLAFSEGYAALLGGGGSLNSDSKTYTEGGVADSEKGFGAYFTKRLVAMMKANNLKARLPYLLNDVRTSLDTLTGKDTTEPFDSIYRMVFKLTMRTVACDEIADDPKVLAQCLSYFETIESSAQPLDIMYPWLPTISKAQRMYAGAQLYRIFQKVIDERKKSKETKGDALQFLLDQGDNVIDVITFVLGALFAGQLNSGINAAYLICCLANDKYWLDRVSQEVNDVADRYSSDKSLPLRERLMSVPMEAWEGEFPVVDICLKDSIRLNMPGTAFRQNLSGHDIPLSHGEVIPNRAFAVYAVGDASYNPEIYPNPTQWDPARYLAPRNEDKKETYAWFGWGAARHPCLGMRFAKLEMSMIVAFFVAYFDDLRLEDKKGNPMQQVPGARWNNHTARKPSVSPWVKFKPRSEAGKTGA